MNYKLLIVDDDPWVREWLTRHVHWEEYGFTEIFEAENGCEAMKVIDGKGPNIVITDIKMDGMSGLELLALVSKRYPEIRVVLLSGYTEFEYARLAIKNGAEDYLLKPVEEQELISLVKRILKEIEQENDSREIGRKIKRQFEQMIPVLQERFLEELLSDDVSGSELQEDDLSNRGIHIDFSAFYIIIFEIDNYEYRKRTQTNEEQKCLKRSLKSSAEKFLNQNGMSVSFFDHKQLVVIYNPKPRGTDIVEQMTQLSAEIRQKLGCTVSVGISRLKKETSLAHEAYMEAFEALKRKFYFGENRAFYAGVIKLQGNERMFEIKKKDQLVNAFITCEDGKLKNLISDIFLEIGERELPYNQLQIIYIKLLDILNESFEKAGAQYKAIFFDEIDIDAKLDDFETLDEFGAWVLSLFLKGVDLINNKGNKRGRKIIEDAIDYTQKHMDKEISLDTVAKTLFVNPAYLSRLFKQEAGETFTHFLMKLRIEKAKTLLDESYLKVYEISEKVGYKNEKYFSRIFRDFEGVTPNEYRDITPKFRKCCP